MKIVCIGGGPSGLYFALLMKKLGPDHDITVVERNKPYDTFGWGVVFSDQTLENMRQWDIETAAEVEQAFNHWDDIELHFKDRVIRSGGHGFVGIGRKKLLNILQVRCEQLGVKLLFEQDVQSDLDFPDADLIIASDGVNSRVRSRMPEVFQPDIVTRPNRFIWLGTNRQYDAFTFLFEKTEHGWFQAHVYKFDKQTSTFIVECPEHVWLAHGLDKADQDASIAFCEKLFAKNLQGEKLMTNARHLRGSAWLNFQRVKCANWSHFNGNSHVVLMGDAVHTAHFAIGSGTKLALEDAIELVRQFKALGDTADRIPEVLKHYQAVREIDVIRLQNAAWNAMEWFEVCGERYCDQLEPEQFMYSMLTRSQRISHENLRLRDKAWLEGYEAWFAGRTATPGIRPPMFTPYTQRSVTLKNRVVVSPMAQYMAVDGRVGDDHLVHLGARAMGGAGLVMVEMTAPSADGRITHGCPGLWNDTQTQDFQGITDWVHAKSDAKIGLQIGHAGPKGSTCRPWQGAGMDQPVPADDAEGNWPLLAASAQPYLPQDLPMSVRISAHDWVEGGITPTDAVEIARAFKAAGADMIDCSSGQVSAEQKPTYGRMYQTPFADRIRQEAGIATIAVGAISEADHVNSILAAGRADLCAVARPHLANPAWTLTEAARIGFKDVAWPRAYVSGKPQLEAGFARERALQTASTGD
eukprot:gene1414-1386_t